MIPDEVMRYLAITRGSDSYSEHSDEQVSTFVQMYKSTLEKHNIRVVIIRSKQANTEILTFSGIKYIVWDTRYFDCVTAFIDNLIVLKNIRFSAVDEKLKSALFEHQIAIVFSDLLEQEIFAPQWSSKERLALADFYLHYSCNSNLTQLFATMPNNYSEIIFYAKLFIFCHEMAHITSDEDLEHYRNILEKPLTEEIRSYKIRMLSQDRSNVEEALNQRILAATDWSSLSNSDIFNEIVADMRSFESVCSFITSFLIEDMPSQGTTFDLSEQEGVLLVQRILDAVDAIEYVRSFLTQKNNLSYTLREVVRPSNVYTNIFLNSAFRDFYTQITDAFHLSAMFQDKYNFLEEYKMSIQKRGIPGYDESMLKGFQILSNYMKTMLNDGEGQQLLNSIKTPYLVSKYLLRFYGC